MYKHCNTEESARRQKQIEHCLLQLMLVSPYGQITIGDICQSAGISRKSFYRYFGSKDDCLHALIDHTILEASAAYLSSSTPVDSGHRIFEHYFRYWKSSRQLLEALCQNQLTNALFERSLLSTIQEELEFRNYLDSDKNDDTYEQMLFLVCGITGLIINWHLSDYQKTPAQMAETVDRLIGSALLPAADSKKS